MALSTAQKRIAESEARWRVGVCGRRFGKTHLAIREMCKTARWPNKRVWYVGPTYRMSKQIAWTMLKEKLIQFHWARQFNEQDLTAYLKNNSTISLRGADNPDSLRGVGLHRIVLDEAADIKSEAWFQVLRPTLSDTGGDALFLGTPKGYNWFHDLYERGQNKEPGWASWQFTTLDGGNVSNEELEAARRDMDPLTYSVEYLATFQNFEGRAYYPFERDNHCASLRYDERAPLIVCFDFNVAPGVAVICQEQDLPCGSYGTGVIGEVWIPRNSNTVAVCNKISADWGTHQGRVMLYGDATGGARGSARIAGSDWDIVRQMLRPVFNDRLFSKVPRANPAERARINAVNTRLLNGARETHLMIDPVKAPHVKNDLEGVRLLEGGSGELDKKHDPDLTHLSDALGYYIVAEFPIDSQRAGEGAVVGFS